jgi:hypothetical protein
MTKYDEIIEKILEEVDVDIRESMLKDSKQQKLHSFKNYKVYHLLPDPANTILGWQALRDRKKQNE